MEAAESEKEAEVAVVGEIEDEEMPSVEEEKEAPKAPPVVKKYTWTESKDSSPPEKVKPTPKRSAKKPTPKRTATPKRSAKKPTPKKPTPKKTPK